MKRRVLLVFAFSLTLFMGGTAPSPLQQRDLDALIKRGFTYRMLDSEMIELTEPVSGVKILRSLRQPDESAIRSWAEQRGVPMLEIDPRTVDTSVYRGWYLPWSQVPVSSFDGQGDPLLVGDVRRSGRTDVYGIFWDSGATSRPKAYEVDTNGVVSLLHDYFPVLGVPLGLIDAQRDSLWELGLFWTDSTSYFTQPSPNLPPTVFQYGHRYLEGGLSGGYTHTVFGDLDGDSLLDLLYKGSERYSIDTMYYYRGRVFVAEYKPQVHTFVRVWSTDFGLGFVTELGGFTVDDFDGDGRREFTTCELTAGRVYMTEKTHDDLFTVTWRDSVPFDNVYFAGSGDIDRDGRPEFFVGAVGYGDWFTMFEADSDNHYSARLLIHLLSGGLFDNPQIMTVDVDGDGEIELVICAGADIYMFKSRQDDRYDLWCLKRENGRDGIQFYDFNQDGRKDLIVGKTVYVNPPGWIRSYASIYVASSLVDVKEPQPLPVQGSSLSLSNYPNPFNPTTTIQYVVTKRERIALRLYNVLGQCIATLVNGEVDKGTHEVHWNGADISSGVYVCRLEGQSFVMTRKLLLIH